MLPANSALEAASTLGQAGRWDEAEAMCRMALAAGPSVQGEYMLGVILANRSRQPNLPPEEAVRIAAQSIAAYRRALDLDPGHAEALNNLGSMLVAAGERNEALDCFSRLVETAPDAKRLLNLSMTAYVLGHQHLARDAAHRAEILDPLLAEAPSRLAGALSQLGHFEEAWAAYERALALDPAHREAMSGLIYLLDFDQSADLARHIEVRRRWLRQRFPQGLPDTPQTYANIPDPERQIRIGYISADFRLHSATRAFAPVVLNHNRSKFAVHLYSNTVTEDAVTARYRTTVDQFRNVQRLDDAALAECIRADGIDLLVDLSGHLASERLGVMALRPAPVQMTAWGAVTGTGTGLAAIDYLIADAIVAPAKERHAFAEQIIDLSSILPYTLPANLPLLGVAPAIRNGFITFGSLNRIVKLWPSLPLYAEVLSAVPGSRLMLKNQELDQAEMRDDISARFSSLGIAPGRLIFRGATGNDEHLAAFNEVDLVLDPVPHTGGVTALDGLLMGVPAVTLRSVGISGKLTSSFQHQLGLDEFSTDTPAGYVALAREWAGRIPELDRMRAMIRSRLLGSTIVRSDIYAAEVEAAYRAAWRKWCNARA